MELFEWSLLGSYAGASFAVALLTQLTKVLPGVRRLPTQLWSYALALATLLLAQLFGEGMALSEAVLAIFNAALVSLAANGGFAAVERLRQNIANGAQD